MQLTQDQILSLFRGNVPAPFGERVHRVIVFGSHARSEATPGSDLDVAVIVDKKDPALEELLDNAAYKAMYDTDFRTIISLKVISEDDFQSYVRRGFSFYRHIVEEGIPV